MAQQLSAYGHELNQRSERDDAQPEPGPSRGGKQVSNLPVASALLFTKFYDIAYSTMDARKLARIRGEIEAARRKPQKQDDLIRLAERLGRVRFKRGKEPTWVTHLRGLFPLSIPHAKGGDLKPKTKNSILNQLEGDVLAWEEILQEQENGE